MPPGPPTPLLPPVTLEHSAGSTFFMRAILSPPHPVRGREWCAASARAPEHPTPNRAAAGLGRNHVVLQAPEQDPEQPFAAREDVGPAGHPQLHARAAAQ